jgi:hypothetical protein
MSQTSTGTRRARRVIRLSKLPQFLGVQRSTIDELVKAEKLHPFCPTGEGGRAQCVFEDEVITLQEQAFKKAAHRKKGEAE